MTSNTEHIVFLIGEKGTGNIDRSDCPQLDARASHGDLACFNCGGYFPMSRLLPLDIDMLGAISEEFRKKHRSCIKDTKNRSIDLYLNL